jgi:hypothetical protein
MSLTIYMISKFNILMVECTSSAPSITYALDHVGLHADRRAPKIRTSYPDLYSAKFSSLRIMLT